MLRGIWVFGLSAVISFAQAEGIDVEVKTTANDTVIGTVHFEDSKYGLLITPDLHSMNPGMHGFHIHEKQDCSAHGKAAGGHLDPNKTGKHLGPYGAGHLGDLPALYVDKSGRAIMSNLAPKIKVTDIKGHSLMIHEGGDNYSDNPLPLGGGGDRLACGVIPYGI